MISYFPNNDWLPLLKNEFSKPYFTALQEQLNQQVFFPAKEDLFKAFALCSFATCKVVILGQDPYHDEGQAHGLAFSVPNTINTPPSLQNIFKELNLEYQQVRSHNDLSDWAQQGVLLLNAALTVRHNEPASHAKIGWTEFTDAVITTLSDQ
ncbi:MAG: uracil-DNA glycosylase, partial [Bacteroidota bacterium]